MKKNCKSLLAYSLFVFIIIHFLLATPSFSHLIQIDHNEFRASGFPKPHLPPPLPTFEDLPQQLIAKELTPSELMVDLTNDITYRILHYHSILNRNNFAFSPTALMSVLVALYEGSAGSSSVEIRNVLQLPINRDVMRIGYRDIHRRLRTYFFGSDNPLKGLSLNIENVTITKEYETVLMFYGYDLGMDMVSSTISSNTTYTNSNNTLSIPMSDKTGNTTIKPEVVETTEYSDVTTESTTVPIFSTTPVNEDFTEKTQTEMTTSEIPPAEDIVVTDGEIAQTEESTTVTDSEAAELVSAFVADADAEPLLRIEKARVSRLHSGKLLDPQKPVKILSTYLPSMRNTAMLSRTSRPKRQLVDYRNLHEHPLITLVQPPPPQLLFPKSDSTNTWNFEHGSNDFQLDLVSHFLSRPAVKHNYNTDIISHVFYLNRQHSVFTTFKVYNAVLYYKYFENLKISVLELELDTPEYNLMILLPDLHTDLVTAAASLRIGPTLRILRKQLKARWVQAIIPDFKLHGTMFLTNDLQNMGILDIFEPNRADFRPMTVEKGVYVKHIEQFINVNIRTHPINQLKRNYGSQTQPIQISVNHPYLFFVIDRDLDVAVMAGRILNPLNVRIQ